MDVPNASNTRYGIFQLESFWKNYVAYVKNIIGGWLSSIFEHREKLISSPQKMTAVFTVAIGKYFNHVNDVIHEKVADISSGDECILNFFDIMQTSLESVLPNNFIDMLATCVMDVCASLACRWIGQAPASDFDCFFEYLTERINELLLEQKDVFLEELVQELAKLTPEELAKMKPQQYIENRILVGFEFFLAPTTTCITA